VAETPQPENPAAPPEASPATDSTNQSLTFIGYQWRPGERACWDLGVSVRFTQQPEKIAESPQTFVGGKLHLVVLNADSNRVSLAGNLAQASYSLEGRRIARVEQFLESTPVILNLSPAGNLLSLDCSPNIAAEDRQLLRLLYGWEFVARNAAHYQEEEIASADGALHFRSNYRRAGGDQIQKSRSPAPGQSEQSGQSLKVLASSFSATVGHVWVSEMFGWEDTLMYMDGSLFAMGRLAVSLKPITNVPPLPVVLNGLVANPVSLSALTSTPNRSATSVESVSRAVQREATTERWRNVAYEGVSLPLQMVADRSMNEIMQPLRDLQDWLVAHPEDGPA
jgi:hypothetical protein